ncbi:MAG: gliding motility-associated C-terminal domain-containing protein [Arcicella sp.]|nr:gliding motility-associated C-terminal domain-containing protein [Arcicella sp.]
MKSLILSTFNTQGTPFIYANAGCATSQGLNVLVLEFKDNIYLDPKDYNDPQGYYIAFDRCCRSTAVSNIVNPGNAGMLFYLEFPALIDANANEFKNSSPSFTTPNGEYICAGQPFTFDNGATDEDGDALRYSFVTPMRGFSSGGTGGNVTPNPVGSSNYPRITWQGGFTENTAIPGSPAMNIDATGKITVTATQLGLYVYSVMVEELRNGVVIGQVRRDFQLKVVDCLPPPTPPVVYKEKAPLPTQLLTLDICETGFSEIATKFETNYQYQWQKDGANIVNAEGNILKVTEAGDYTVTISYKTGCSGSSESQKTIVSVKPADKFQLNPPALEVCDTPTGVSIQIEKIGGGTFPTNDYSYLWTFNNRNDTIKVNQPSVQAKKTGKYVVNMDQISGSGLAVCQYELTSDIIINPLPDAVLSNISGIKVICEGDSIVLNASQKFNNNYDWQQDGVSVERSSRDKFGVKTLGLHTYRVEVTDDKGCKKMSDTLKLKVNPQTPVRFDSISPQCGTGGNRIDLKPYVTPYDAVNGKFSGRGIDGTIYSPLLAGYGPSSILYTYTNNFGCVTKANRIAFVDLTPKIQLGNDLTIFRGDTVRLKSTITGSFTNNVSVQWSPTNGLDNPAIGRPLASPNNTQIYVLSATAPLSGCKNQDTIVVIVKTKIVIPQGFTPNDDSVNDAWILEGIEDYPDSEVSIFNRWGGEIFKTKNYPNNPFNGKNGNDFLPMGTYFYVIKTGDTVPTQTGYLTLVRGGQ